jgi:hypothetical protein
MAMDKKNTDKRILQRRTQGETYYVKRGGKYVAVKSPNAAGGSRTPSARAQSSAARMNRKKK